MLAAGGIMARARMFLFASLNKSSGGLKWHTRFQRHTLGET
jgi:hypothetical protein